MMVNRTALCRPTYVFQDDQGVRGSCCGGWRGYRDLPKLRRMSRAALRHLTRIAGAVLVLASSTQLGQAAGQGGIGATSTGTIGISVTIPASVYLQSKAAPSLDIGQGSAAYAACLAGKGIDAVTLAAEGSGVDGAFAVTGPDGADVAYVPALNGKTLPASPLELAPPGDCVALELSVAASDPDAVKGDGPYAGVLTLIVTPE